MRMVTCWGGMGVRLGLAEKLGEAVGVAVLLG